MSKHGFWGVLGGSIIALVLGIYLSSLKHAPTQHAGLPWQIDVVDGVHTRVFSLVIGQSTLGEAEQVFKEYSEITLFIPKDSKPVIEAFFNEVTIANFKSKMVMSIQLLDADVEGMFKRGIRISTMGSGTRKVTLSGEDANKVRQAPIASITYLPSANLDAESLQKRFGIPAEKIADPQSDAIHWLYPEKGVDIALSETEKDVIIYTMPSQFNELLEPLKNANAKVAD